MVGIATAHFPNNQLTHWLKWRLHNDDLCVQLQCRVCDIFIPRHFSRLLTVGDKCQQIAIENKCDRESFPLGRTQDNQGSPDEFKSRYPLAYSPFQGLYTANLLCSYDSVSVYCNGLFGGILIAQSTFTINKTLSDALPGVSGNKLTREKYRREQENNYMLLCLLYQNIPSP